jgi:alpha-galactosidase
MLRWLLGIAIGVSACHPGLASDQTPSWHLNTADTTVVITVRQDAPLVTWLGSTGNHQNWLAVPITEELLPVVSQKGVAVPAHWTYSGQSFDRPNGKLILRFTNAVPALELQSIWQGRTGHGPIEHWLTITNHSGNTITAGHQDSLVLNVNAATDRPMQAWWVKRGGGNASTEGGTLNASIGKSFDVLLNSDPLDGASPVPWLALQSSQDRGLYVGWEFSGLGRIHASAPTSLSSLKIEVGNRPEFKTDIAPEEMLIVPPAFVGCYTGDIDDGSYTLHRFVLEKLRPKLPPDYPDPTLAYNLYLDSGGPNATEQSVLGSAALANRLGFESFVLDAMWFPQSGDWRFDPARFPRGSGPVEQYIHAHDMKLGLWMAYTHGSDSTDPAALNITKHSDWFAAQPKLNHDEHLNWDALIDLGSDPAREWVEQATARTVSDYKIDYFKTDYSPIVTQCMQSDHRHHYGVDVSYWSTLGYYAVQENLLHNFPRLMIEGCSGAGHIKDFGDIQRVHYIAVTDTLSSLPDRQAIYDSTFAFPPAVLMAYTYENHYNTISDTPEPYFWRSAMMSAWQIDPTHSASWTPAQIAKLKKEVEIYKGWIRPILKDVEVHHMLPRPDGHHWDGMFYWSPSLKRGTVYVFRPDSDESMEHIRLKGLEPHTLYKVRTAEHSTPEATYSGDVLMQLGLSIQLPEKYSSDLVFIEK